MSGIIFFHDIPSAISGKLNNAVTIGVYNAVDRTVTGKVVSESDGSGMPGVNIIVKGSNTGTTTDASGMFSLQVDDKKNPVLVFSFIGHESQEITVNNQSVINVSLKEGSEMLKEVVVTALDIKREAKSLGYAVGQVAGKEINRVAQENVLNSLAGKVPGVTISSTGGTGSSVSMVIRGATSLSSDNQPLFVVDGVPLTNTLNNVSQVGDQNYVDYGNSIGSLNPEDIENISILKGPNAAALYGSRAGNGVVLITTKNGSKAKKMTVSINSSTVFDKPYKFLDMHSKFATGILPFTPDSNPYPGGVLVIDEGSAAGVGPELDKGYKAIQWNSPKDANGNPIATDLVSHPNNVKNFVKTGITTTNGFSIMNNTEQMNYRLSYTNMTSHGIIPNSDLFRNTININTTLKVTKNFRLSTNVDFSRNNSNNRPATNRGANPLQAAYAVSPHIDIRDLKDYWMPGQEGVQQRSQNTKSYDNPYFLANEVNNSFVRDRVFGNIKGDWQITPHLSLMGRYSLDTYKEQRQTEIGYSFTKEAKGSFGISNLSRFETNADFLATYKRDISDFSLSVSAGGNSRYQKNMDVTTAAKNKTGLTIPGLFTLSNIAQANINYTSYLSQRAVYSVYGLMNLGYKDMIFLDVTARNDWSSTLPKANRSYFYPSASLSILINEMAHLNDNVNLLKLRGGVAQVGNDTGPYSLYPTLGNAGAWDGLTRLTKGGTILLPNLKPEIATSYEAGVDLNMFRNKLRFAATYYVVENRNQIIPTTMVGSSGFTSKNINAGLLVSKGLEISLGGTVIDQNDWKWDVNANWSRNRTKIKSLADNMEFYTLWSDAKGGARTYVGENIGDLFDAELVTVQDKSSKYYGYPLLDDEGSWQDVASANSRSKIGNFNPDFILGMQTSISYKRFSLNMSFDWRNGGDFISQTYRYGESDLKSQRFLDNLINPNGLTGQALRDHLVNNDLVVVRGNKFPIVGGPTAEYGGFPFEYGGKTYPYAVFNPGVRAVYAADGTIESYEENLGGEGTKYIPYGDNYPWSFMRAAMFDASFLKLREISFGYDLPSGVVRKLGIQSANVSVYSRNIILWTKAKIGVDPEQAFQQEPGAQAGTQFRQGIERYNVTPWVIPVGFKIGITL